LFALNAGDIVLLAPTIIITQTLCEVCAVSDGDVRDIAEILTHAPVIIPMTGTTLDGVWADIRRVGATLGRGEQAESLLATLLSRIRRVHYTLAAAGAPRLRVAVIEWLDPIFAAGHWTPELVRRAGGIDVLAQPGTHSERIDVQQIRDAAPELLLFAPCGFDVDRAECEAEALLSTDAWAWARDIETWALDGNALTSRPGPRLADAIEVIASIVAPRLFEAPAHSYARRLQPIASDLRS
jgi:iron complex transport system substrate-binding protein